MASRYVLATVNQGRSGENIWLEGRYHTFYYTREFQPHSGIMRAIARLSAGNVVTIGDSQPTGSGFNVSFLEGSIIEELTQIVGASVMEPVYATVEPVKFSPGACFRIGAVSMLEVVDGCMLTEVKTVQLKRMPHEDLQAAEAMSGVH